MNHYRGLLQSKFDRYQQRHNREEQPADVERASYSITDELDELCDSQTALQAEADRPENELIQYLAKGKFNYLINYSYTNILTIIIGLIKGYPRIFWKDHEQEYPVLARLARDNLSIPASGAGVERLFNCARDICHYRRGQLKKNTIRDLMIHLCSTKFEREHSELDLIREQLSIGEAALSDQAGKPIPALAELDPISGDEKQEQETDNISDGSDNELPKQILSTTQSATLHKQTISASQPTVQRKRRVSVTEPLDEPEEYTLRRSARIRKRSKMPDGFEMDRI